MDLNGSEEQFIKSYGHLIAGIMLYGGNSYLAPNDDAPRAIDVCANPEAGGYLLVGVGRPRALYVLYPWKGRTVLCQGAVLPYYEFVSPARLTDEAWRQRLDAGSRPPMSGWLAPVVSETGLGKPQMAADH